MNDIKSQLKAIKTQAGSIQLDRRWINDNRTRLLAAIRAEHVSETRELPPSSHRVWEALNLFISPRFAFAARAVSVLLVVVGVAVGSVSASQDSLPGDFLYPIRWTKEAADVVLAPDKETKVRRLLDQAEAHVEDIAKAKTTQQGIQVAAAANKKIQSVNEILHAQGTSSAASNIAKVVEEKTEAILTTVEQKEKTQSTQEQATKKAVEAVVNQIEETNAKAVEVLVSNDTTVGGAAGVDVTKLVQTKLDKIAKDIAEIHDQVTAVQEAASTTAASLIPVTSTPTSMFVPTSTSAATGTENMAPGASLVESPTATNTPSTVNVQEVEAKVRAADVKLEAAQTLILGDNLKGALEKFHELYEIKKETKAAIGEINNM